MNGKFGERAATLKENLRKALTRRAEEGRAEREGTAIYPPSTPVEPIRPKRKDGEVFKHLEARTAAPIPLKLKIALQRLARETGISEGELVLALLLHATSDESSARQVANAYRDRDRKPEEVAAAALALQRDTTANKDADDAYHLRREYREQHAANVAAGTARTNRPRKPG